MSTNDEIKWAVDARPAEWNTVKFVDAEGRLVMRISKPEFDKMIELTKTEGARLVKAAERCDESAFEFCVSAIVERIDEVLTFGIGAKHE